MKDKHFRLIFEGLEKTAQLPKLVVYLQKELGLSENAIRNLLTNPPRVLWEVSNEKALGSTYKTLEKMGCKAYPEAITGNGTYPFSISESHHKLIRQELSKILRVRANLALFLIQVSAQKPEAILPSMMGPFRTKIETHFRESDTVIGIDDTRLIVLGFSTDKEGVKHLEKKTNHALAELLGDDIQVSTGYALFPQEGRNLARLIELAEDKRRQNEGTQLSEDAAPATEQGVTAVIEVEGEQGDEPFRDCFAKAKGKLFHRLVELDPEILWIGLGRLPEFEQREFLGRLPFDSPLCPILEHKISQQAAPTADESASNHFEAIMDHMALQEGLGEKNQVHAQVSSKLQHIDALPTLPSIAAHIFKIASNPNSSAEDLTRIIVNDPPLTSKLLKMVNSAFYGFPQKIGTVKQVVVILGTEEIMDLALGLAAARVFQFKPVDGLCDPKALWHHSLSTALIAQHLCQRYQQYQKQGAFTAGLLHDFGKIFLMENFADLYGQLHLEAEENSISLVELEEEHLGLDHAVIGQSLASNWNLPDPLVKAIAFHHRPFSAPEHSEMAAMIGLADYLHHQTVVTAESTKDDPLLVPSITYGHWNVLRSLFKGLDSAMLGKMAEDASAILDNNQDLFEMLH